ncbi:hypothetical protein ElyMa_005080100 [Elysia marginata]|uniref:C3H1-type domain-containing protein n=1 Tax=Elysia marginata TaxID=1093978 RepID=A0AAV4JH19_9GAST|nr:hypothetical protein ElyMa_005080100 [Elysia marginata]
MAKLSSTRASVILTLFLVTFVASQTTEESTQTTTVNQSRYAEIVFDNLYHLVFPKNKFLNYKVPKNPRYGYEYRVNQTEAEVSDSGDYGNNTFLCRAGDMPLLQSFTCSRRKDSYQRCLKQENCRFVHFETKGNRGCDTPETCINVALSGYSVQFTNVTDNNVEFKDGACGENSPLTTTTSPTSTTSLPEDTKPPTSPTSTSSLPEATEPMLEKVSDSKDGPLIITAALGWAFFALTLAIIVSVYICRHRLRQEKQDQESILEKSPVHHNASYGVPSARRREGSSRGQPVPPVPPTAGPEVVRYEEATPAPSNTEPTYLDLVEEDDVYTVIEDETTGNGARKNSKTDDVKQPSTTSDKREEKPTEHTSLKYGNLSETDRSKLQAYEKTKELKKNEVEPTHASFRRESNEEKNEEVKDDDDYSRLQAGRSEINPKVTDSFLATYNTATDDPGENTISANLTACENLYPLNNDTNDVNRNSCGYTLLETEQEDSLCRDSAGYTSVNKQRSVKKTNSTQQEDDDRSGNASALESGDANIFLRENHHSTPNGDLTLASQSDSDALMSVDPYEMAQPISG